MVVFLTYGYVHGIAFYDTRPEADKAVEDALECHRSVSCITFSPDRTVILNTRNYERILVP